MTFRCKNIHHRISWIVSLLSFCNNIFYFLSFAINIFFVRSDFPNQFLFFRNKSQQTKKNRLWVFNNLIIISFLSIAQLNKVSVTEKWNNIFFVIKIETFCFHYFSAFVPSTFSLHATNNFFRQIIDWIFSFNIFCSFLSQSFSGHNFYAKQ